MERLAKTSGAVVMALGALGFAVGLSVLYKTSRDYGFGYVTFPLMLIGSGLGVFISGVVVAALGEIISRLPAPISNLDARDDPIAREF
jgi:disulfide bond formation protein DsbB